MLCAREKENRRGKRLKVLLLLQLVQKGGKGVQRRLQEEQVANKSAIALGNEKRGEGKVEKKEERKWFTVTSMEPSWFFKQHSTRRPLVQIIARGDDYLGENLSFKLKKRRNCLRARRGLEGSR